VPGVPGFAGNVRVASGKLVPKIPTISAKETEVFWRSFPPALGCRVSYRLVIFQAQLDTLRRTDRDLLLVRQPCHSDLS
jgi:hypothetical protein